MSYSKGMLDTLLRRSGSLSKFRQDNSRPTQRRSVWNWRPRVLPHVRTGNGGAGAAATLNLLSQFDSWASIHKAL